MPSAAMSRNTVARDRVCKLRRSSSVVTRALSAFSGFSQAQSLIVFQAKTGGFRLTSDVETIQVKIRIPIDDAKFLDKLRGALLTRNDMATMLLHAAVDAVREEPDRLKFPPRLHVAAGAEIGTHYALNEPTPRRK